MAEIKPAVAPSATAPTEAVTAPSIWPVIGKAWFNTDKKGRILLSISVGNRREPFGELVLKPGDRIVLRPNSKRPGKKDADYQACLVV